MSLLNPGMPAPYAFGAPPPRSASFGTESSSTLSTAATAGLWVGAAALLGYALLRNDAPARRSPSFSDY
jgi:hypothetical protein